MKALLITRCGCSRLIDITSTYPILNVPMNHPLVPATIETSPLDTEIASDWVWVRQFKLYDSRDIRHLSGGTEVYIYREVAY